MEMLNDYFALGKVPSGAAQHATGVRSRTRESRVLALARHRTLGRR